MNIMKIMSDFREAMWGLCPERISTSISISVGYANQHFPPPAKGAQPQLGRLAQGISIKFLLESNVDSSRWNSIPKSGDFDLSQTFTTETRTPWFHFDLRNSPVLEYSPN